MRDPLRIPGVLEKVQEVWELYPDMRLAQLLLNIDVNYNTEDRVVVERLDAILDAHPSRQKDKS